jgi:adenosylcobinamide-GDP ribazoletransferase
MRAVRGLAAAVAFLTRIPVGRLVELDADDVALGAPALPLVGGAIGAFVAGIAEGAGHALPALVAAGLGLTAGAALTGALHLDALADSADALTKRGEVALAIMREHTIGVYGATALFLDLLVKAGALATLVAGTGAVGPAVAAGALARAVPLVVASALPPLREQGLGTSVASRVSHIGVAAAVVVAVALSLLAGPVTGLELTAVAVALTVAAILFYRHWLGGVTGDLLGAATEVTETTLLVVAAALLVGS